jgi:hypothetical protein
MATASSPFDITEGVLFIGGTAVLDAEAGWSGVEDRTLLPEWPQ